MANAPSIKAKVLVRRRQTARPVPDAHRHLHERGVFHRPRHPRQLGRCHDVVLRVGAGSAGYFWTEK